MSWWGVTANLERCSFLLLDVATLTYLGVVILGLALRRGRTVLRLASGLMLSASTLVFVTAILTGTAFVRDVRSIRGFTPFLHYATLIDPLSTVLLTVISVVSMASSIYTYRYMEYYEEELGNEGVFSALMSAFIASMTLIVVSNDILWFLFMWEVMTFTSYLLITWEFKERSVIEAGWKYFTSMHFLSTLPLIIAVVLSTCLCGATSMELLRMRLPYLSRDVLVILYALYLVGFAAKAGVVPFHFWLPDAHPAAPSNVSALLSGVMIKVAVYGLLRFCCYVLPLNNVLGYVVASLGALSLTIGTLYALKQTDAKRLLAYHSVGQMGYIWLGLGAGIVLLAQGNPLGVVGIVAGLYHLVNHAMFKGLLFLSSGSILYRTRTKDLNVLGGLARVMPYTSAFTLIAALSIAGIPPFNGFLSKWLIYESTFSSRDVLLIFYGVLALFISAATLASFLKFYTTAFTGDLKTRANPEREVPLPMLAGMFILAFFCVLWGVLPSLIVPLLQGVPHTLLSIPAVLGPQLTVSVLWVSVGPSSFSPPMLILFIAVTSIATVAVLGLRRVSKVPVWDTGSGLALSEAGYKMIASHYYRSYEEAIHALYGVGEKLHASFSAGLSRAASAWVSMDRKVSEWFARCAASFSAGLSRAATSAKEVYIDELIFSPLATAVRELSKFLDWTVLRTDLNTYLIYSAIYIIILSVTAIVFVGGITLP